MPSREPSSQSEPLSGQARTAAPRLRLVKSAGAVHELTPLEREFLPPFAEIQETPPSPVLSLDAVDTHCSGDAPDCLGEHRKRLSGCDCARQVCPGWTGEGGSALEASMVKAIHVTEGQRVRAGDLLLELDPALSAAELQADSDKYGFNQLEQARLAAELRESRSSQSFKSSQPATGWPWRSGFAGPASRLMLRSLPRPALL